MGKIGVGVGDDFPVDDENGGASGGQQGPANQRSEADDRAEYEMWKRRRDAWRAEREARRAEREAWKARKRAFKRKLKEAIHDSFGDEDYRGDYRGRDWNDRYDGRGRAGHPFGWRWAGPAALLAIVVPFLILMLVFALISAAFKAPFVILAVCAIVWIVYGMRHHHRHDRGYRYYYDGDIDTPPRGPRPQQPPPSPPQSGAIITPPPATQ